MKLALKWIGIVLGALVGLIVLAVLGLYVMGSQRASRKYSVTPAPIAVPSDADAIARGEHLAGSLAGCTGCHGENLGGTEFINDPVIGLVYAPNLTTGQGGAAASFSDGDWVRAVRHGVAPDGRALVTMPSETLRNLSAEDLGAVIAYAKSVPPVDNDTPDPHFTFLANVLLAVGAFGQPYAAEYIDHAGLPPVAPPEGVTPEYGGYLVGFAGCQTCHGPDLTGGQPPEPGSPPAADLTPGGELGGWTETDFLTALRTGQTPDGRVLSDYMPWEDLRHGTDDELKAIWLYLQSLPKGS